MSHGRWRDDAVVVPGILQLLAKESVVHSRQEAEMSGSAMLENYQGSCHCGRVRFRVRADLSTLLECNCSVCTKKGIVHLIVPPEQFELLEGGENLATYQFNTNTARHTFCRHCGMHPFYVPRSDPDKISVNARCLDGVDPAALRPAAFFDGRNWEAAQQARLATRQK